LPPGVSTAAFFPPFTCFPGQEKVK
jgi:hypothetical protein